MLLQFSRPLRIPDIYSVPVDHTVWQGQYFHGKSGYFPDRARASFGTTFSALVPKTPLGDQLDSGFGLYVLVAEFPVPHIYFGIAAEDGRSPEGFRNRIRKHRLKLTASHVGVSSDRMGGVHHPERWRHFAIDRQNAPEVDDVLSDVWIATGRIVGSHVQLKAELEIIEDALISNTQGCRDQLTAQLWPQLKSEYKLLNGTHPKPIGHFNLQLIFS